MRKGSRARGACSRTYMRECRLGCVVGNHYSNKRMVYDEKDFQIIIINSIVIPFFSWTLTQILLSLSSHSTTCIYSVVHHEATIPGYSAIGGQALFVPRPLS